MKKLLLGITILACTYQASATRVITSKCDGGPNGYANVNEYHGSEFHGLNCYDPGAKMCMWKTDPPSRVSVSLEEAEQVVSANVAEGVYEGSIEYDDCILSWSAQSPKCYSYSLAD